MKIFKNLARSKITVLYLLSIGFSETNGSSPAIPPCEIVYARFNISAASAKRHTGSIA
jgi:hypothetical protein